jgi:hypothetical protein
MAEPEGSLQFNRAEYADPSAAGPKCANCKEPIAQEYWKLGQQIFCGRCRAGIEDVFAKSKSAASFGKAVLWGGGVAVACGIGYAVVAGALHMHLALITIGIAYVVAKVIRKASRGVGGRRYQLLAVALTYFASTMGYVPSVIGGISGHSKKTASAADSPEKVNDEAPAAEKAPLGPGAVVVAAVVVVVISLAAPFLEITDSPLGLLIVLFGLWEAWKLSRGVTLNIEGPLRVGAAAPPPP